MPHQHPVCLAPYDLIISQTLLQFHHWNERHNYECCRAFWFHFATIILLWQLIQLIRSQISPWFTPVASKLKSSSNSTNGGNRLHHMPWLCWGPITIDNVISMNSLSSSNLSWNWGRLLFIYGLHCGLLAHFWCTRTNIKQWLRVMALLFHYKAYGDDFCKLHKSTFHQEEHLGTSTCHW
jgi:hypothetical protein